MRNTSALLVWLPIAWACTGCGQDPPRSEVAYYLPRPRALDRINRVVMVELAYDGLCPGLEEDMTQALAQAVQARNLFHVEVVRGDDPELQELLDRARGCKTLQDLGALRKAFKCDALLVGSIRHFEPYPRMQIMLYLQLLDLKAGRLVWGVEHKWDTADRGTRAGIREFFDKEIEDDVRPLDWRLATVSPKFFQKFVAYEAASTLRAEPPASPPPESFRGFIFRNLGKIWGGLKKV